MDIVIDEETTKVLMRKLNKRLPKGRRVPSNQAGTMLELASRFNGMAQNTTLESNLANAKKWLDEAKQNLTSAKLLLEGKQYKDSMMLLEYSAEKLVKAYFIAFFQMSDDDVKKKIGHDAPSAFIMAVKADYFDGYIKLLNSTGVKIEADIGSVEALIKTGKEEFANMTPETIDAFFTISDKIDEKLKEKNGWMKSTILKIINDFRDYLTEDQKKMMDYAASRFEYDLVSSFIFLYYISFITYAHFYTRYPNSKTRVEYSPDLGIVQKAPDIISRIEKSMQILERYLEVKHGDSGV